MDKSEIKKMKKPELLELTMKLIELCEENNIEWSESEFDYDMSDEWDSSAGFKYIDDEKKYEIYMCGGCREWWNYVITPSGTYIENTHGLEKIDGDLWSCPEGYYISEQDDDYKSREGENCMTEMVNMMIEEDD